jgi:hypothetical protein
MADGKWQRNKEINMPKKGEKGRKREKVMHDP